MTGLPTPTPAPELVSQTSSAAGPTTTGQPARRACAVPRPGPAVPTPLRTWLLIGATFAALVAVMFMDEEQREQSGTAKEWGTGSAPGERAAARVEEQASPPSRPAAPAEAAVSPPAERASAAAQVSEREAAELLLAGREREALAAYHELAAAHPQTRVYAAIVKVLERRLASRCNDRQPGGTPCVGPP